MNTYSIRSINPGLFDVNTTAHYIYDDMISPSSDTVWSCVVVEFRLLKRPQKTMSCQEID